MRRALEGLRGTSAVDVSLDRERAVVDYDPSAVTIPKMLEAIQGTVVLPRIRRAIGGGAPRRPRQAR